MTEHKFFCYAETVFQLTSSRRGWRRESSKNWSWKDISTHILTKRMTGTKSKRRVNRNISTHILTKRMTKNFNPNNPNIKFQLTSSRRGWRFKPGKVQATIKYFNSHPHEEDDHTSPILLQSSYYFNSHPHEEDDRATFRWLVCRGYFNSHPHEEDDIIQRFVRLLQPISTHILTKRMTENHMMYIPLIVFQLTSSRRGWRSKKL